MWAAKSGRRRGVCKILNFLSVGLQKTTVLLRILSKRQMIPLQWEPAKATGKSSSYISGTGGKLKCSITQGKLSSSLYIVKSDSRRCSWLVNVKTETKDLEEEMLLLLLLIFKWRCLFANKWLWIRLYHNLQMPSYPIRDSARMLC